MRKALVSACIVAGLFYSHAAAFLLGAAAYSPQAERDIHAATVYGVGAVIWGLAALAWALPSRTGRTA